MPKNKRQNTILQFAGDSMYKFNTNMPDIVTFNFNFHHLVTATLAESVIK